MGKLFGSVPVATRAERYRELADAAFLKATRIDDATMRVEYLALAAGWHAMAQELEKDVESKTQLEESQRRVHRVVRQEKH